MHPDESAYPDLGRPASTHPSPRVSLRVHLQSVHGDVDLALVLDEPALAQLVVEDTCWQVAVEQWRTSRPGWWQRERCRVWRHERRRLAGEREDLIRSAAAYGVRDERTVAAQPYFCWGYFCM